MRVAAVVMKLGRRGAGGVHQHGRTVREYVIETLAPGSIDRMDIQPALFPGREDFTDLDYCRACFFRRRSRLWIGILMILAG